MLNHQLSPEEGQQTGLGQTRIGSAESVGSLSSPVGVGEREAQKADLTLQPAQVGESDVLSPQGAEAAERSPLLDKLIGQAQRQRRWRKISAGFYYGGVSSYIVYGVLHLCGWGKFLPPDFMFWYVLLYASALMADIVLRWRWGRSATNIANIDDVRAVGALAEALDIPDIHIREKAETALARLLPRLTAEEARLLTETQRHCLYRRLKIENAPIAPGFMVALLDMLGKFGDAGALPAVQTLAGALVTSANGKRVQAAARECLSILRKRIVAQETSGTLLRASSPRDDSGATLLRPAQDQSMTAPEELLRAIRPDAEPR